MSAIYKQALKCLLIMLLKMVSNIVTKCTNLKLTYRNKFYNTFVKMENIFLLGTTIQSSLTFSS